MPELLSELQKPESYPHETGHIQVITTAISWVFLTGKYAYKICKPVNFGFLDFSTLEKRKKSCYDEVAFNKLISPDLYLGVTSINKDGGGKITLEGSGEIIEYAIKMKQLDSCLIMTNLLKENKVSIEDLKALASGIFNFHKKSSSNEEISAFGSVESIQSNWDENFEQTEKYKNKIVLEENFLFIQKKVNEFTQNNKNLFVQRVEKGRIKHCHGDFHSANVFVTPEIYIFDGIVFNKRFPCSDVIAEIAFMAMDLDFHERKDLAEAFIERYLQLSQDQDIPKLLNFYKCYRAYIRGKINCFTSEDKNLTVEEREKTVKDAKRYFQLATQYAELL